MYFLGSKISGFCIFLGLQYEAPSKLLVVYTTSAPAGPSPQHWKLCENNVSTYFALIPLRISFTFQIQYAGFNAALQKLRSFFAILKPVVKP